jgi:hypothetical protein
MLFARFRAWLAGLLHAIAWRIEGLPPGEWETIPIHRDDMPGAWVSEQEAAYQALIPFGYPTPEGQEVDWTIEPSQPIEGGDLVALFHGALRQRITEQA